MYALIVLVTSLIVVIIILSRHRRRVDSVDAEDLYQDLLIKALGDKDLVERMIELERSRNPNAGRESHMQAAISRWERHNR
jgi:hypothetical protein